MKMKISLCTSLIILYFGFVASQEKFNALFFNRKTRSLIEIPKEIPKDVSYDDWASACPASNDNEEDKKFNQEKSFCKNSLFVRNICQKNDKKTLLVKICDDPFQLSIAMHEKRSSLFYFEFGYEIYINPLDSENFKLSDKRIYRGLPDIMLNVSNTFKRFFQKSFNIRSSETKDFIWIPLFEVKTFQGHLFRIRYEIRRNNRQPFVKCKDYSLGKEAFREIDIDTLYFKETQKKALEGFNIPETLLSCDPCFEKWLLIPADQFQFGSSVLPTCSNMVTIPVWSSLVGLLEKLDKYLYALSKVLRRPLHIVAGIRKNLRYPLNIIPYKKSVTLSNNGYTIFVPKVIYKLVQVQLKYYCTKSDPDCWYGVVIVIHNDPTFKIKQRICTNKTEDLGWEDLTTLGTDEENSKYIYVCPITPYIFERLKLKFDKNIHVNELSLKTMPKIQFRNEANPNETTLQELISNELKRGLEATEDELVSETKEEIVERPLFDDDGLPR